MTAAAFEARLCPPWPNEIKKTKLYSNTSPAAGINFLLAPVPFYRYSLPPPFLLSPCPTNCFVKLLSRAGQPLLYIFGLHEALTTLSPWCVGRHSCQSLGCAFGLCGFGMCASGLAKFF